MADTHLIYNEPANARWTLALAHGAGAGMDTPFMTWFAECLAKRGMRVVRFEFPYMARRRSSGKGGPPDKAPVLMDTWRQVIDVLGRDRLLIGGKSMGGRVASMVAEAAQVKGLICLGYPFHPVGKPAQLRIEHLQTIAIPTLILQGTRDPFGIQDEVKGYDLPRSIQVHWLDDGDHDFKPRKVSGRTQIELWEEACSTIDDFAARLAG